MRYTVIQVQQNSEVLSGNLYMLEEDFDKIMLPGKIRSKIDYTLLSSFIYIYRRILPIIQ